MARSRWRTAPTRIGLAELCDLLGIAKRTWYARGHHRDSALLVALDSQSVPHGKSRAATFDREAADHWVSAQRRNRLQSCNQMVERFQAKKRSKGR